MVVHKVLEPGRKPLRLRGLELEVAGQRHFRSRAGP
jgi:hypothetical protein